MLITLQPSSSTDHITNDGTELQKRPYPFYADEEGNLSRSWDGAPTRIIGFVKDLSQQVLDVWWEDAVKDIHQVVGMYVVTTYPNNQWATHLAAIETVKCDE